MSDMAGRLAGLAHPAHGMADLVHAILGRLGRLIRAALAVAINW